MAQKSNRIRRLITVRGLVQGVGFRPFVYRMANAEGLHGWVSNTLSGVVIDVEGSGPAIDRLIHAMEQDAPARARVDSIDWVDLETSGHAGFGIRESESGCGFDALAPPDMAICPDCLREISDPANRRFNYPFTNCTNCGPRYTIVHSLPYDRPSTAMNPFTMCPDCAREYSDPMDRRFHAQPNACPACGPHLWFEGPAKPPGISSSATVIETAISALNRGATVALKGLGGFHLVCDATNDDAVRALRARKNRPTKPFAVMMRDLDSIRNYCRVGDAEALLLQSPRAPIVILDLLERAGDVLAESISSTARTLGVMLPYTPLHHLLLRRMPVPLVMTSGNVSEEPLVASNAEALHCLPGLADGGIILHDRDIPYRCDDSVVRIAAGSEMVIRRARGYAPEPLPFDGLGAPGILALGGHEKAAFCLTRDGNAFLGHYIGDLDSVAAMDFYMESLAHYKDLFGGSFRIIACDFHPGYATSRMASAIRSQHAEAGPVIVRVQHHHAHVAAVMGEWGLDGELIGVSCDGTGLGDDGILWGGEILLCSRSSYRHFGGFTPAPLPGGETAIRHPVRAAYGLLALAVRSNPAASRALNRLEAALPGDEARILRYQCESGLNTPQSSSLGRLFDAAGVLCGFGRQRTYDGEAAVWLENLADLPDMGPGTQNPYSFSCGKDAGGIWRADSPGILAAMAAELENGTPRQRVARRFHEAVAEAILQGCLEARKQTRLSRVALGGGVFQNRRLLESLCTRLGKNDFSVFIPRQCPPNDGGLAYGQAVVACAQWREEKCALQPPAG